MAVALNQADASIAIQLLPPSNPLVTLRGRNRPAAFRFRCAKHFYASFILLLAWPTLVSGGNNNNGYSSSSSSSYGSSSSSSYGGSSSSSSSSSSGDSYSKYGGEAYSNGYDMAYNPNAQKNQNEEYFYYAQNNQRNSQNNQRSSNQNKKNNADDDVFHWNTNVGFGGISIMPLSCINLYVECC
jgi:hypothetical protein